MLFFLIIHFFHYLRKSTTTFLHLSLIRYLISGLGQGMGGREGREGRVTVCGSLGEGMGGREGRKGGKGDCMWWGRISKT